MSEDELPFVCSEHGCGMRFTNEDHLSVHMRKHDMSLALNLSAMPGGLSPLSLFPDQTPTPTKFLKNCEEMGLFQELTKNPFDDSFKKAMDDPIGHSSVDSGLHLADSENGDLDTPQPPLPRIIIEDQTIMDDGKLGGDKVTLSSIVPKKRKKFMSQGSVDGTQFHSVPTSTTSEDEEEPMIASSSTEDSGLHSDISTHSLINNNSEADLLETGLPSEINRQLGTNNNGEPDVIMLDTEPRQGKSITAEEIDSVINSTTVANDVQTQPVLAAVANQSSAQTTTPMSTILLQLPGGQLVPVKVPANMVIPPQVQQAVIQPQLPANNPPITNIQVQPQVQLPLMTGNANMVQTFAAMQTLMSPQGTTVLMNTSIPNNTPLSAKSQPTVAAQLASQAQPPGVTNLHTILSHSAPQSTLRTVLLPNKQPTAAENSITPQQHSNNSALREALAIPPVSNCTDISVGSGAAHSGSQAYTQQRLKAALQQQTTPTQRVAGFFQVKQETPQWLQGASDSVSSSGSVTSPDDLLTSVNALNDAMMLDTGDGAEDRRTKFLERNRAAAARCREKRKRWVNTLQQKSDDLANVNSKLCSELKKLRAEVANLKTLMLAHKDCPVTLMQRQLGQIHPDAMQLDETAPICLDPTPKPNDNMNQSTNETLPAVIEVSQPTSNTVMSLPAVIPEHVNNVDMGQTLLTLSQAATPQMISVSQPTAPHIMTIAQPTSQIMTIQQPAANIIAVSQPSADAMTVSQPASATSTSFPVALVPNLAALNPQPAEAKPLSVITGTNSHTLALLPKLFNFDNKIQIISSSKS